MSFFKHSLLGHIVKALLRAENFAQFSAHLEDQMV